MFYDDANEMQNYKSLSGYVNEAVPRGEDIRCCVLYFAYELVLF